MLLNTQKFCYSNITNDCSILKINKSKDKQIFIDTFRTSKPLSESYFTALEKSFSFEEEYLANHYLTIYNSTPVGVATVLSKDNIAGIYGVGTYMKYRNKGFGTKLMKTIIKELLEQNINNIFLITKKNSYAEKYYTKIGFEELFKSSFYVM